VKPSEKVGEDEDLKRRKLDPLTREWSDDMRHRFGEFTNVIDAGLVEG
jgi:hypothetical protein